MDIDPSKLGENEYNVLINGRSRYDNIQLVNKPVSISAELPAGNFQGCYAADRYAIAFVDGKAYYKDFLTGSNFIQIAGFQMDANVDYLYAMLVPASSRNFARTQGATVNSDVFLTSSVAASPQTVVVQDGVNQAELIDPTLGVRTSQNYGQWTVDSREYVPIGKQMAHVNNKLYIVSVDGKEIYHSVSGRPLDFVVAIDGAGDKIDLTEAGGGAGVVSISVDYNAITCIAPAAADGALLVTSSKNSYMLVPLQRYVYGEPEYTHINLFATGAVNQFSVADILGDTAIVSFSGIHSFNAARQLRNEGKNAPFSSSVYKLFEGAVQSNPCSVNFDDYAMFSVNTIYGAGVLVYDTLRKTFNGIDIYEGISPIEMFAEVKIAGVRKLLFMTADGIYCFGDSDETETCKVLTRQYSSVDPKLEMKPTKASLMFCCVDEDATGSFRVFMDRQSRNSYPFSLVAPLVPSVGAEVPIAADSQDNVKSLGRDISAEYRGNKLQLLIEWSGSSELNALSLDFDHKNQVNSPKS